MTESLNDKIKVAAVKVDEMVDFRKISGKISNKTVRLFVSMFEIVDGYVFKTAITEVVELIPVKAHPVVEGFLDAFIAEDYLLVVNSAGSFLTELNLIPIVKSDDQKNVYIALLTALVRLIPQMNKEAE
jgi:hypothetical protein